MKVQRKDDTFKYEGDSNQGSDPQELLRHSVPAKAETAAARLPRTEVVYLDEIR